MPLDPKLRDVLDFLPCEPCLERPSPDQEALCSICHRLNRTVALRCQVSLVSAPEVAPSEAELEAAREDARLKQAEFEALQERRDEDSDAYRRIKAERDELLARQRELEDRLARLEAQSHGGQITFVDDGPTEDVEEVVEFSRVDLGPRAASPDEDEEVMEFESLGTDDASRFSDPDADAWTGGSWEDEEGAWPADDTRWESGEASWADPDAAPPPGEGDETVSWDEEAPRSAGYGETEEAPWERVAGEGTPADTEGRAHATTAAAAPEDDLMELDEQTRADLSELEAQLAELESELQKRRRHRSE